MHKNIHPLFSEDKQEAIDLIRWVYAVAKYPADSPRFAWYVSRWLVPEKIARAKEAGTFDDSVKNCPPIDPAWVRFVPAALQAYREFIDRHFPHAPNKPASSSTKAAVRNTKRRAA